MRARKLDIQIGINSGSPAAPSDARPVLRSSNQRAQWAIHRCPIRAKSLD
jgi:hypothetical protein